MNIQKALLPPCHGYNKMNYGDIFERIRSNLPGQDKFVSYRFNSNVKDYFAEKGMHVFCTCKFRIERYAILELNSLLIVACLLLIFTWDTIRL